jgi:hypothetical protein
VRRNPYSLTPTDAPRLLRNRRREIGSLVNRVAPVEGEAGHALIVGEARTGRTSTLLEVGRRVEKDRNALAVPLQLLDDDLTSSGLPRALLGAAIERLVSEVDPPPDWYLAWCDRVHLRNQSPASVRDLFVSGLSLAADSSAIPSPAILQRDLRTLTRLAAERGYGRIVVYADDAGALLEDISLTERLVVDLDAVGNWSLILVTDVTGIRHLVEAVSPSLRRFRTIPLEPFWSPEQIRRCLTAPLNPDADSGLMPTDDMPLLFEIRRLTSGNPFEIALVARHLWMACTLGEQEHYELTPRVLRRVVGELSLYTGVDEDLLDGVKAVRNLAPEEIAPSLDLIALSQLTPRQIAIARALGLPNSDDGISCRILECDLDQEEARVVEDLKELERKGVVSLAEDRRFAVQGGRTAAMMLKYEARSLLGPGAAERTFDMPFLPCVGMPLAADCAKRVREKLPSPHRLGWMASFAPTTTSASARLRAALNAQPFVGLDLEIQPFDRDASTRMTAFLLESTGRSLALVDLTLAADGSELDRVELWEVPDRVEAHDMHQAIADVLDEWQALVVAADIDWRGSHAVVLKAAAARTALIQLMPLAPIVAIGQLFDAWQSRKTPDGLVQAISLSQEAIDALQRAPDREHSRELSITQSCLGFLLSLSDDRLDDAREALLHAQERGPGDGWVTDWNLANIAARLGDLPEAQRRLAKVGDRVPDWTDSTQKASVSFYVPGRAAKESLVTFNQESGGPLFALQHAVFEHVEGRGDPDRMLAALKACGESADVQTRSVAKWVAEALQHVGVETASSDADVER